MLGIVDHCIRDVCHGCGGQPLVDNSDRALVIQKTMEAVRRGDQAFTVIEPNGNNPRGWGGDVA